MTINNLPATLQSIIQEGYLQREWEDVLRALVGFRSIADKEIFPVGIGETITKTRPGLVAPNLTPLAPAANSDITGGITPNNYAVEQFTLTVNNYAFAQFELNIVTSKVAIQEQFLLNAKQLGYSAMLGLDQLAQQTLFNAYMGGNTRVTTTLSAAGTAIHVDDIRGFRTVFNSAGVPTAVSSTYPMNVTVGSDVYSLVGTVADGSNVSTAPGGISGTLTFASDVTIADGTAGNSVISATGASIVRPSENSDPAAGVSNTSLITTSLYNSGRLSLSNLIQGVATLRANAVPTDEDGYYVCFADPFHFAGLYGDPAFQQFFRGRPDGMEYRRGLINDVMGLKVFETNVNPIQPSLGQGPIHRSILCGQGALIESDYTASGYAGVELGGEEDLIEIFDGVAHVVREPLDPLKQVVTQTCAYLGGFVCGTDMTANPTTIPTANNAFYKRAVIFETL